MRIDKLKGIVIVVLLCVFAVRWVYAEYTLAKTRANYSTLYEAALERCPDALIVTVKLAK